MDYPPLTLEQYRNIYTVKVLDQASSKSNRWTLYHGDCVEVLKGIPDNSIDFVIYSPPFSSLYIYSESIADLGNSTNTQEFFRHYNFLLPELLRVTVPGRLCVVHCKDLPLYMGRDGAAGLDDFPGDIVRAHREAGWVYHSNVTIWKDPVIERSRTNNHGLLYKELCKDSACSRQGMADFLKVFRKWDGRTKDGFPKPVQSPQGLPERFGRYLGENPPLLGKPVQTPGALPAEHANPYPIGSEDYRDWSIQVWQRYASPVWFDIDQMDTLNYELGKDSRDAKHICPLQLGVIRRCLELWTNPDDVVLDPFNGVGSSGVEALKMHRRFVGVELKDSYFEVAKRFLASAEQASQQRGLFD